MDAQTRIRKIIEETNCSFDVAKAADEESNGNVEVAIQIAKKKGNVLYSGGQSGLFVEEPPSRKHITQYKNGVMVEDKFYDFSIDGNIRLKEMLEEKTFDASLLGSSGDSAEVVYSERLDEEYKDDIKKDAKEAVGNSFVGEGRTLRGGTRTIPDVDVPDELEIVKDGDAVFKVMIGSKRVTVRMLQSQTIGDFFSFMERYYDFGLVLSNNDKEIPPNHKISEISKKLLFLSRR